MSYRKHHKFSEMQHYNTRTSLFIRERSKGYHRKRRRAKSFSILACDGGSLLRVLISSRSPHEELHRLFPFLPHEEYLLNAFTCALSKDILLQGKMFVTQNWICFYSNIFGFETKLKIEMNQVVALGREKTAFVVPNAISIKIPNKRYVFCSFLSRETVFRLLSQTWKAAIKDETPFDSTEGMLMKTSEMDLVDCNHNETTQLSSSATELAIDHPAICSDNDIDRTLPTPVLTRNNIFIPNVIHLKGIQPFNRQNRLNLSINSKVKMRRWNTMADLRELEANVRKRRLTKRKAIRGRGIAQKLEERTYKGDTEAKADPHCKASVVRWMKLSSRAAFPVLHRISKWCTKMCSFYLVFAVIIIVLGVMSVLLLYKINNLSLLFAERNINRPPICASSNNMQLSSDDKVFTTKLQRLNNILSSNLQAVHQVKDSLKRIKKDLGS